MSKPIDKEINGRIPPYWIPYKNRWGHYVWRAPDGFADMSWPGAKPPTGVVGVEYKNGRWVWIKGDNHAEN